MRLIDADALMPKLKDILEAENQIYGRASWDFSARCVQAVENAPTIESEIIRCKDCKFSHMTNDGRYCKYCDQFTDTDDYGELVEMYFDSNFYCGYAERRTE